MHKRDMPESSWDPVERWYSGLVGEKGHHYHQTLILPNVHRLLAFNETHSLLDLGCGNGVLARSLPKEIEYVGVDSAAKLLRDAKKMTKGGQFIQADATRTLPVKKRDFDRACFILSLQNMEDGLGAITQAKQHLKTHGKLLIVLNHPAFRIPRQSAWGEDIAAKMRYRRINAYMSPMKIPIQMHPGKQEQSQMTYSYHQPLSVYSTWLFQLHFAIEIIEEWCSPKTSEGKNAKMEDRARREIPLFMAILARSE